MRIALCGSTRFHAEFNEWNAKLSLAGHTVYSLGLFGKQVSDVGKPDENLLVTDEQKVILDLVHLDKIDNSEAILVLNVGGYIGDSTFREMLWAQKRMKCIYALDSFHFSRSLPSQLFNEIEPIEELLLESWQ